MSDKTLHRARLRSSLAVLGAATLLVGGIQLVATAATGGPLLLGKSNTANKTTKLKTTGNKAALALKSKSGKAPLKVSNSTLIKKLNADLLDGASASTLDPAVTNFSGGPDNGVITSGQALFTTTLPAGTYEMSLNGLYSHTGPDATYFIQCLALDRSLLGPPPPVPPIDYNRIYLLAQSDDVQFDPAIAQSNIVTLPATTTVLYGCTFSDEFTALDSADLHVRKVNTSTDATGTPTTLRPGRLSRLTR